MAFVITDLIGSFKRAPFPMGPILRILVVDDHDSVRRGICALFRTQPYFEVVCEAADGIEAVTKAEKLQPDVIVLDITMPRMGGFEAARRIGKVAPSAEIVFLSQHDSVESVRQGLRYGRAYVVKSDAAEELIAAVRAVSEKKHYVNARFAALL